MEPQKPGNYPGSGPEFVERQKIAKEQAAQTVHSWTVQDQMRGVRRRCRKNSRFCQSYRDKSLTVGCIRCSEDEREYSERDEGA